MTSTDISGHKKGLMAEMRAALHLRRQGFEVLASRYKTPCGEIDLVAKKGKLLVFVEVKKRKSEQEAAEAIDSRNQKRVADAAALYLQEYPDYNDCDMRFDAIIFYGALGVRHIEGAWEL